MGPFEISVFCVIAFVFLVGAVLPEILEFLLDDSDPDDYVD